MKIYKVLIIVLVFFIKIISAQENEFIPNMPSPTSSELGKYGSWPVDYYNGLAKVNIPIYTVSTGSLQLPISLSYHGSGIKVEQEASWVGLGWSLNAGGVITCKINGSCDFFPGKVNVKSFEELDAEDYYTSDEMIKIKNYHYDTQPDIFAFNFNGYIGEFILEKQDDGSFKIHMLNNNSGLKIEDVTVDFAEFNGLPLYTSSFQASFVVVDKKGIRYHFTQEEKSSSYYNQQDFEKCNGVISPLSLNINRGLWESNQSEIVSWYLTKIESPFSSQFIKLEYDIVDEIRVSGLVGVLEYELWVEEEWTPAIDGCNAPINLGASFIKVPQLARIITSNNIEIEFLKEFTRVDKTLRFGNQVIAANKALSGIEIKINSECIEKWKLSYDYFDSGITTQDVGYQMGTGNENAWNYRLKLDEVQKVSCLEDDNINPYKFNYYGDENQSLKMPFKYSCSGKDKYGYCNSESNINDAKNPFKLFFNTNGNVNQGDDCFENGLAGGGLITIYDCGSGVGPEQSNGSAYTDFIKDYYGSEYGTINYNFSEGSEDISNLEYAELYSLKEIVYPTGGKTIFEYETNIYYYKGNVYDQNQYNPSAKYGGGLRIKKLTDVSNYNDDNITEFDYMNSGVIQEELTNAIIYHDIATLTDPSRNYWLTYGNTPLYTHSPVSYQYIKEGNDNGKILYNYTSYYTWNSEHNLRVQYKARYFGCYYCSLYGIGCENFETCITFKPFKFEKHIPYYKHSYEEKKFYTGKLKSIFIYDNQNNLISKAINNYDFIDGDYIYSMENKAAFGDHNWRHLVSRIPTGKAFLNNTEITRYFNGEEMEKEVINYEFDFDNELLLKATIENSKNQTLVKSTTYPISLESNDTLSVISKMKEKNMKDFPIEITECVDGNVTSAYLYNYDFWDSGFPEIDFKKLYVKDFSQPILESSYTYYNGINIENSYHPKLIIEKRDFRGNIIQYQDNTKSYSSILLWGYNLQVPIAQIENMTIDEFLAFYNNDLNSLQNKTELELINIFNSLRENESIIDAMITSFTYDNRLNPSTITDVSGVTKEFAYDDLNRLKTIILKDIDYDGNQTDKILQHINYHFIEQ